MPNCARGGPENTRPGNLGPSPSPSITWNRRRQCGAVSVGTAASIASTASTNACQVTAARPGMVWNGNEGVFHGVTSDVTATTGTPRRFPCDPRLTSKPRLLLGIQGNQGCVRALLCSRDALAGTRRSDRPVFGSEPRGGGVGPPLQMIGRSFGSDAAAVNLAVLGVSHARNRWPTGRRGNLPALVRPVRWQRRR